MKEKLRVTGIRYFDTRRGIGYQCQTNKLGVEIWNDGDGGATYVPVNSHSLDYATLSESTLESLIDEYEGRGT